MNRRRLSASVPIPPADEQTRDAWARAALAALDRWRTETDPR